MKVAGAAQMIPVQRDCGATLSNHGDWLPKGTKVLGAASITSAIVAHDRKTHHLAAGCIPRPTAAFRGAHRNFRRPRGNRIPAAVDRRYPVGLRPHSKAARTRAYSSGMAAPLKSSNHRSKSPRHLDARMTHDAALSSAEGKEECQDPERGAQ